MNQPTLVLAGTGKTGSRIAARLSSRGIPIRIGSRTANPPFDWENPATWPPALQGVGAVYVAYQPDLAFPGAAETAGAFARLAAESGVRRVVLLSGRGEEGALRAEQAIQNCGAQWTIVRAAWFSQNFSESFLREPVLSGEIAFPAGDVAEPFVDVEDVADVAAAALTEDGHASKIYEVTGPRLLTFASIAGEISRALDREVRYVPISQEEFAAGMLREGLPSEFVTYMIELIASVFDGRNARLADGVQRALGREPRDFSEYAREAARSGVWNREPASTTAGLA